MTEQEAIEIHMEENIHRIEVIEGFMQTNSDADKPGCRKNIEVLTKINGLLQEIQQYRAIGTVEKCRAAVEKREEKGFYDDVPDDFKLAVEVIKQYCQNEDCMEDCSSCPYPIGVIRCADKVNEDLLEVR